MEGRTLAALCALAVSLGASAAAAAPQATEARLSRLLEEGRTAEASSVAESLAVGRARRAAPVEAAAYTDSLALLFYGIGGAEGWGAAEALFTRSLALRESALGANHLDVARVLVALASLDDLQGQWNEAAARAGRALEIRLAGKGEGDLLVASSRRQLGMIRFWLGEYAAAESLVSRSLAAYEAASGDQSARVADGLNNLGEICRAQGRFERAAELFTRGLALAGERLPPDAPLRGALMNNLAGLYNDLGRFRDAEPLYVESLRMRRQADPPDPMAVATATLNLAELYRLQERPEEAEPLYLSALETARATLGPDNPDRVPFAAQAAVFYRDLDRPAEAEQLFREALGLLERTLGPEHPLRAQALLDVARMVERRGAFAQAETLYHEAVAIRVARLGERHPEAAVARAELARCLSLDPAAGDAAAMPVLEQALAVLDSPGSGFPEARMEARSLRAEILARAGRLREAVADLGRALDEVDSLRLARGGGQTARAIFLSRQMERFHRMLTWKLALGDVEGALAAHERARARVLLDQIVASRVDLRSGIAPGVLAALDERERRARADLAAAQRALELAGSEASDSEAGRYERLASLEVARDAAAREVQGARAAIEEASPVWRELLTTQGRFASAADVQSILGGDECALVYHLGGDRSFVFFVPRRGALLVFDLAVDDSAAAELGVGAGPLTWSGVETIMVGVADSSSGAPAFGLADVLSGFGRGTGVRADRRRVQLERRLHALWRSILPDGLWSRLRGMQAVVIVPDGALHLLPFETLVVRSDADRARFVIDEKPALRYAASATSLVAFERRDRARGRAGVDVTVLSVSDPAFGAAPDRTESAGGGTRSAAQLVTASDLVLRGGGRWQPLPGTRQESAAIAAAFPPGRVELLQDSAATEPAVRAALPRHRVLHLATHGFVTAGRGDVLAGLVLASPRAGDTAPGTGNDGALQLFEIYELPLACDLAVLSACETARGPRVPSEGVFALSRGFQVAGARRVVATLWPINDRSTSVLMGALFRRLAKGGDAARDDVARELRDARREVRRNGATADPFHWGPFVLTGVR
jgi:CHAT domain-containing protein/tetratricopeptide (TPR) repeat protein